MEKLDKQLTAEFQKLLSDKLASPEFLKFFADMKAAKAEDTGMFRMIISTGSMDRQGEMVSQDGYKWDEYMANPVVLFAHDYFSMPVGITDKVVREGDSTIAEGRFAPTPEGQNLRKYYEAGFPIAASIGFIPQDGEGGKITAATPLEWSFCAVPANGGCVPADEARMHGVDIELMKVKGITFVETKKTEPVDNKAAQAGDACEMDDGTPGTFSGDPLVCKPDEAKAAKPKDDDSDPNDQDAEAGLWDRLKAEHDVHISALKAAVEDCWGKKSAKTGKEKLHKAIDGEHGRHVEACEKCLKDYIAECWGKSEGKLLAAVLTNQKQIEGLTEILKKSSQAPAAKEEPRQGGAAIQKSSPSGSSDDLDKFEARRAALKSVATAASKALELFREEARQRFIDSKK
jgi:hypothetical protein